MKATNAKAKAGSKTTREPGKQYQARLEDAGLSREPIAAGRNSPRQFQVALIAATLAKASEDSATKLATRALEIWNASGTAVLVEAQADVLAKGALHFDVTDWQAHANALVEMLDANGGGVPGQKTTDQVRKCHEQAQADAAKAVYQLWQRGPENETVLASLFIGKAETLDTRKEKFLALLQYAKQATEKPGKLGLGAKTPNRVCEAIRSAWMPLCACDDTALTNAVTQVNGLLQAPKTALVGQRLARNPLVARWLVVVRAEQLAEAKNRAPS